MKEVWFIYSRCLIYLALNLIKPYLSISRNLGYPCHGRRQKVIGTVLLITTFIASLSAKENVEIFTQNCQLCFVTEVFTSQALFFRHKYDIACRTSDRFCFRWSHSGIKRPRNQISTYLWIAVGNWRCSY